MSQTLRWKRLFPDSRAGLISWTQKAPGETFPAHDHDFPEVFWIRHGEIEHTLDGEAERLTAGRLVFVRAENVHAFRGVGAAGGEICNFAVRADVAAHVRRRYLPRAEVAWWAPAGLQRRATLPAAATHALDLAAREYARVPQPGLFETERFLLNLLHAAGVAGTPVAAAPAPAWMSAALDAMDNPGELQRGPARFAQLAGCTPAHLARTVRAVHGVTPTALLNARRLDRAAVELQFTARPIVEIALELGFDGLSHFYRLFRRRFGTTPRDFRLRARTVA